MKLNPKKYTFGVEEGMFLGYKVITKGLKVCPDKVDAVLIEKSLPFFKTLKKCTKKSDFHWTTEAKEAFEQMKQLIAELPMLTAPMEKEELIVYLAATKETILSRLEVAGRLQKWSIELGEYAIHYRPRVSIKGHILAYFIVKRPEEDSPDTLIEEEKEVPEPWILFTDGSSCTDGSGAGLILTNPEGREFTYALRIAKQMGVKKLQANVDSRLVANQVNETYVAKETDMVHYLEKLKALTGGFKAFTIKQIPRSENKKANALSKIASTSFAHLSKQVLVKELKEKSISEIEVLMVVEEEGDTWMTPIFKHLTEETLPANMKKARAIKRKSWRFAVINGILYKKSFLGPWPSCHPSRNRHAYAKNIRSRHGTKRRSSENQPRPLRKKKEQASIREAKSKAKMERYYNSKVHSTSFKPGYLVFCNNEASRAKDTWKLGPKWEGPYEVTEALGKGAYKLKDHDGKQLPRTWNISNLKKCYVHKM
ncbi:reverse transcriptase domain-containing protein [Tanacetum coccineum]